MKLSQLTPSVKNMLKEDELLELSAIDAFIINSLARREMTISQSAGMSVTHLGDFTKYEGRVDFKSTDLMLNGLTNVTSLEGLPASIGSLEINGCGIRNFDDLAIKTINFLRASRCDALENISLHNIKIDYTVGITSCKNLKTLEFGNDCDIDGLDLYLRECNNLKSLITPNGVQLDTIKLTHCDNLLQNIENLDTMSNELIIESPGVKIDFSKMTNAKCVIFVISNSIFYTSGLSQFIKMIDNGLKTVRCQGTMHVDVEKAFKIIQEIIDSDGNTRVKMMKFTQRMTEEGLEKLL